MTNNPIRYVVFYCVRLSNTYAYCSTYKYKVFHIPMHITPLACSIFEILRWDLFHFVVFVITHLREICRVLSENRFRSYSLKDTQSRQARSKNKSTGFFFLLKWIVLSKYNFWNWFRQNHARDFWASVFCGLYGENFSKNWIAAAIDWGTIFVIFWHQSFHNRFIFTKDNRNLRCTAWYF